MNRIAAIVGMCLFAGVGGMLALRAEEERQQDGVGVIREQIMAAQKLHVRESSGTYAYQCFTSEDYQQFRLGKVAEKVAEKVVARKDVQAAIVALRAMPTAERDKLLATWRRPLRKTWSELGRITAEGQTLAGQKAEIEIANAVVNAVLACCCDPEWKPADGDK